MVQHRGVFPTPAMLKDPPANASPHERIELLKEQIEELKEQKQCYDDLIRSKRKLIAELRNWH